MKLPGSGPARWLLYIIILAVVFWFGIYLIPVPAEAYPDSENLSTLRILDRHGNLLREVCRDSRGYGRWVSISEMSPHLISATICQEDRRFYKHPGIDPVAVARAIWQNLKARRIVSGASTITMQAARQVYHINNRGFFGKLYEMLCALRLERKFTKDQILELYLNRVSYGNRCLGVESASRLYFDMGCNNLSLAQAAFLAVLPRAPTLMDPYRNPGRALSDMKHLLSDMENLDYEKPETIKVALDEKIKIIPPDENFLAPHFCDYVLSYLRENGITGAMVIRTTLSLPIQKEVERLLLEQLVQVKD
ncbi:MAG: transglycosylase domain-containing protein, partial [Candidatus Eremiobacteraeota bacterium]|nr:transglycosylase domain-containing protein [Candidatus Eremiobacteraeota bacterium]